MYTSLLCFLYYSRLTPRRKTRFPGTEVRLGVNRVFDRSLMIHSTCQVLFCMLLSWLISTKLKWQYLLLATIGLYDFEEWLGIFQQGHDFQMFSTYTRLFAIDSSRQARIVGTTSI